MAHNCLICGERLRGDPKYQLYCSIECSNQAYFQQEIDRVTKCKHCGKEFRKTQSHQKYCSPNCGTASIPQGRFTIHERDNFTCIYCGRSSYRDHVKLHIDHIIPRDEGGGDEASNLVTSCQECNLSKHAKMLSEINLSSILKEVSNRNKRSNIEPTQLIKWSLNSH